MAECLKALDPIRAGGTSNLLLRRRSSASLNRNFQRLGSQSSGTRIEPGRRGDLFASAKLHDSRKE